MARQLATLPSQDGATVEADGTLGVTFVHGPGNGPDLTYAALPRWDGRDPDAAIRSVAARMRSEGSWPSLLLTEGLERPPDLPARLERAGWLPAVSEMVMWVGHASVVPHLDPSLRIEAVQPRSLEQHESLERSIFGIAQDKAAIRREAMASALQRGALRAWLVWLEDEPVAVARLSPGEGVAALQGIGVTAARRGQGLGTLITTIATRAGMATGHRLVWLSVRADNEPALRTYRRLGFEPAFGWTRWLVPEDPRQR
jgi:ribosomal protein S18 acetylase RimI-like enzyme